MANGIAIKDVENKLQALTGDEVIPISNGGNLPQVVETSVLQEYAQDGVYKIPEGGIPSTDLDSDVQASLGKADSAVPATRKVNNKALSSDVTLTASDVGALPDNTVIPAAQVNSDWNANSGVAQILNKPTIPAAQIQSDWEQSDNTKKDYIKNKPTIPAAQVNSDWNASSGVAEILNKPTIPDISNCIQTSSTAGLVKNDGTIDTSTYLTSQLYTSAYCYSNSNERYKKAYCSGFSGFRDYGYVQMIIAQGNSCNADFYISVNESGSRRVYIDGVASSGTNYNLQAGSYIVYFDQNGYYFNTNGTIPRVLHTSSTSGFVKNDGTIDTNTYLTSAHEIPSGGNSGQILSKNSATDYDVHWVNQTTTYPSAYCTTAGGTATKVANCTLWTNTQNTYLHILMGAANTYQGELKLKVNALPSLGATIYINGTVSSSTNYTLPAGSYIIFYDGTNYYFNTDGTIPRVQSTTNLVTTLSSSSTDDEYPSAKCVYDLVGDIETLLAAI